jgi:50S ribosomal protein L16 3-hydroxylase
MKATDPWANLLGGMPLETFFRDYWQKKPLLIRGALPDIPVIDTNELAGYALEKGVESRLIVEHPKPDAPLHSKWTLTHGPLTAKRFKSLPDSHWTLLVQAVNQLHPDIRELLQRFRFIPNWRIDDVMVSYAADKGGVGPHFDYYDVFLLQASGKRRWRIGQACTSASPLRADTDCKILQNFSTQEEWVVEPGDLLYIPPSIAHWGVAEGECMTYSVGFRAPSYAEILLDYSEEIASTLTEDQRFADPDRTPTARPGLISDADIQQVRSLLQNLLLDETNLAGWFGRFMTQPRREAPVFDADTPYPMLAPGVRAAFRPHGTNQAALYVEGGEILCSLSLAEALCAGQDPGSIELDAMDLAVVDELAKQGFLV